MIDFQRLRYEADTEAQPFEEKVVEVRYDPCRWDGLSPHRTFFNMHAEGHEHLQLVLIIIYTGLLTLRWLLEATGKDGLLRQRTCRLETSLKHLELLDAWQVWTFSWHGVFWTICTEHKFGPGFFLFYFAVSANEGDSYPLGALPVGTLVNNLEIQPGKGSEYIRAAGNLLAGCVSNNKGLPRASTVSCQASKLWSSSPGGE